MLRPIVNRFDPQWLHRRGRLRHPQGRVDRRREVRRLNHVILDGNDGNTWEAAARPAARAEHDHVHAYVKNDHLGFTIPYVHKGRSHSYVPDFLVRLEPERRRTIVRTLDRRGLRQPEEPRARPGRRRRPLATHWCAAVNNHGGFGRWGYIEMTDPLAVQVANSRRGDRGLYGDDAIIGDPDRLDFELAGRWQRKARSTTGPTPVEAITHDDKRTNIPTADAQDVRRPRDRGRFRKVRYARRRDRSTRSSSGGARTQRTTASDLVADAPPIYIQEKIDPRVLIENLRRTAAKPEDEPELDALRRPSTASTSSTRSSSTSTTPTGRTA